jgi:uncharacterized protein
MVPLDDQMNRVSEFLLVPWAGACVHTASPPPNLIVHVEMEGQRPEYVRWWDPAWMTGRLMIESTESVYGTARYQLTGVSVALYHFEDGD